MLFRGSYFASGELFLFRYISYRVNSLNVIQRVYEPRRTYKREKLPAGEPVAFQVKVINKYKESNSLDSI